MTDPSTPIGAIVGGRYELVRKLGQGGMGEVYEARRTDLGDRVAVKLLREEDHEDTEIRARFLREARTLAQVTSPHVVRVVDFRANEGEVAFLVMEYLEGQNANEIVRMRGPFSAREVLPLVKQLCAGVGAIHALGLVHRDIKPQNIMIVAGGPLGPIVKLVDFGLAKSTHLSESPLTDHLTVLGTPSYMAPEQVGANATIDARADVYGTAATFVAMATGKTLYEDEGVAIVTAILAGKRLSVHRVAPELGPTLCATLERAMSGDRNLRHATIEELSADIERGLLALGSSAHATLAGNVSFVQQTIDDPPPASPASFVSHARSPSAPPPAPNAKTSTMPPRSGTAPLAIPMQATVRPLHDNAPLAVPTPGVFEPSYPAPHASHFPIAVTPASAFQPSHPPASSGRVAIGTYPPATGPAAPGPYSHPGMHGANVHHPRAYGPPAYLGAGSASSTGSRLVIPIVIAALALVVVVAAAGVALVVTRGSLDSPRASPTTTPTSTAVLTSAETPSPAVAPAQAPPAAVRCVDGPAKCAAFCSKLGASWRSCDAACANTETDPSNCGACGNACANKPACRNGRACSCRAGRCVTTKP